MDSGMTCVANDQLVEDASLEIDDALLNLLKIFCSVIGAFLPSVQAAIDSDPHPQLSIKLNNWLARY